MKTFKQKGENPEYPKKIEAWRESDNTIPPTWLSDRTKILEINEEGKYVFEKRSSTDGSVSYLCPDLSTLVRLSSAEDYLCYGDIDKYRRCQIFGLTEKQLNLLYREV